jgi:hypothetical protein
MHTMDNTCNVKRKKNNIKFTYPGSLQKELSSQSSINLVPEDSKEVTKNMDTQNKIIIHYNYVQTKIIYATSETGYKRFIYMTTTVTLHILSQQYTQLCQLSVLKALNLLAHKSVEDHTDEGY